MPALTRLNLARNRLNALPENLLEHLSSLRELDLSDNIISRLQPEMFYGARSLSKLSLARNPLRTLQVTPFLNIPGIVKLDVSRCNLERVWSEARSPLKSLRWEWNQRIKKFLIIHHLPCRLSNSRIAQNALLTELQAYADASYF